MRWLGSALTALCVLPAPTHAAWVWVYDGEQHVLMPPEEGQPPWAGFPDANGDGTPDPVITKVELRIEDEKEQTITRARLGQTIRLVAEPELGGMELEPLTVKFRLAGPVGEVEVVPDIALREATVLGTAPAVFTGSCTLPEPPGREFLGEWQASVEVKVGDVVFDSADQQPVGLRVVGPRETTPEKVGRKVGSGLRSAGREVKKFGEKVAGEVGEWLEAQKREEVPGALEQVQPRQTLGMVERVLKAPDSPLAASESLLAIGRATALRSRVGPQRSLLVVPLDQPSLPGSEYWFPVGYMVLERLRPPGVADLQAVLPWACDGDVRAARITLEAEPGSAEGSVHMEAADGKPFVTVPAKVEWFGKVLWPGQTELRVQRHPTPDTEGLIDIKVISAVPGGAVRIEFALPLVPADEAGAPPAPTEEGTSTPTEPT